MSGPASPTDHAATDTPQPVNDAPASAPSPDAGQTGGTDAKSPTDGSSPAVDTGATKDAKPTLLDVLKTAADEPTDQGKSPAPAKDGKDKAVPLEPAKDRPAATDEDDKKLSFHAHPRWQEVVGQNKQLRDQVHSLEPDADQFRKINTFMGEHHLSPDEVGEGFILMAMMKAGDPRALQKLDDYRSKVALAIGEALPPDIQEKVETGEISEAAGKDLAKTRATLKLTETREAERTARETQDKQTRDRENMAQAQANAVAAWDVEQRKSDPDFAKKENAIAQYARALMQQHGLPKSPEQAVQLIKAAYVQVNKDFAVAMPPKSAVRRVPVAPSSNGAQPAPKNLREVVERAAMQS